MQKSQPECWLTVRALHSRLLLYVNWPLPTCQRYTAAERGTGKSTMWGSPLQLQSLLPVLLLAPVPWNAALETYEAIEVLREGILCRKYIKWLQVREVIAICTYHLWKYSGVLPGSGTVCVQRTLWDNLFEYMHRVSCIIVHYNQPTHNQHHNSIYQSSLSV